MTKNYNAAGEDRKKMVAVISEAVGQQAIYTRMPECAYLIGDMKVTKTGELVWDERTDDDTIAKVTEALRAAGFMEQEPAEDVGAGYDTGKAAEPQPMEGLSFSFPRADFTDMALNNLRNLVASRATLIQKSLQADSLDIEIDDEKVTFPWWNGSVTPEQVAAYGEFLAAVVRMAKEVKRVTAKEQPTESEKYTFRTWLLRLGFIGADHKKTRAILMEHLTGYAAFKNQADAEAFFERQKAKKAADKTAEDEEAEDEISE